MRLKPGKNDRNLPIRKNSSWGWGGMTFRQGPDLKYRVLLAREPDSDGGTHMRPQDPLAPGEYGLVAIVRGQPNRSKSSISAWTEAGATATRASAQSLA